MELEKYSKNVYTDGDMEMHKKKLLPLLLSLVFIMMLPIAVQAAIITECAFDKDAYNQGETGYITVTVYNDKDDKIRVTEITATIDYYYTDRTVYLQAFFTNATLPIEIERGQSSTFYVPLSLPTNIASGYINVFVRVKTELWSSYSERWFTSDNPTYEPVMFIETPYKQQFEQQQALNEQLQEQLDVQQNSIEQLQEQLEEQQSINTQVQAQLHELQTLNNSTTMMMYVLGATTILFVAMTVLLMRLNSRRRTRIIQQPEA
jgi:hypothetical protein